MYFAFRCHWSSFICRRQAWSRHVNACAIINFCNASIGITVDSNFDDAPHAILLLFKIATGERSVHFSALLVVAYSTLAAVGNSCKKTAAYSRHIALSRALPTVIAAYKLLGCTSDLVLLLSHFAIITHTTAGILTCSSCSHAAYS
jgi:hypothetical protein